MTALERAIAKPSDHRRWKRALRQLASLSRKVYPGRHSDPAGTTVVDATARKLVRLHTNQRINPLEP